MKHAKHTPGPWTVVDRADGYSINAGKLCLIAKVGKQAAAHKANARLIAASPEMLSAIEFVLNEVTVLPGTGVDDGHIGHRHINALKAALLKATGGAE